jgi:hypothetical protein
MIETYAQRCFWEKNDLKSLIFSNEKRRETTHLSWPSGVCLGP